MPLPVSDTAGSIAGVDYPIGAEHDRATNAVDLRLDRVPVRGGDGRAEGSQAVVSDELREDVEHVADGRG